MRRANTAHDHHCKLVKMSNVYSSSRPAHDANAQNPEFAALQNYAYKAEVQELMQNLMTNLLIAKPAEPIDFMIKWLEDTKAEAAEK